MSGNGTALDLGDAPEPEELLVLKRRFGDCEPDPEELLILCREGDGLFVQDGEFDLDLDCGGVSSSGILAL